jgi:acyl-phosphate glycerol 3-phosphate acyltransferase
MSIPVWEIVAPIAAYVVGSIPFGYIIAKAKGVDIRQAGSGNVGATNVGRVLGRPFGVLVFVLDFLKGAVPAGLAVWWRGQADGVAIAVGLGAVLGHMFSLFLQFTGGKGVATAAGTVAVLLPGPTGLAILAFTATILAGHIMSISSIVGASVLAISQLALAPEPLCAATMFALIAAALVVVRHRSNITRLRSNTESRLNSIQRLPNVMPAAHVLALALWFGAGWFFSLGIATQLFTTFNALAKSPPDWLTLTDDRVPELGNRLAGAAVGPIFPRYFLLQAVCAVIAVGAAIGWAVRYRCRVNTVHAFLLLAAVVLLAIGWPVNRIVSDLRMTRYESDAARAAFATWHFVSLFANMGTLTLISPALALTPLLKRQDVSSASDSTNRL